jgi:hypothetical protein
MKHTINNVNKTINLSQIIYNHQSNIYWFCIWIIEYQCWYHTNIIVNNPKYLNYCADDIECYKLVNQLEKNLIFSFVVIMYGFFANFIFCFFDVFFYKYTKYLLDFINQYAGMKKISDELIIDVTFKTLSSFVLVIYLFVCDYRIIFCSSNFNKDNWNFKLTIDPEKIQLLFLLKPITCLTIGFMYVLPFIIFVIIQIITKIFNKTKNLTDNIKFKYIQEQNEIDKIV